MDKGVMPEGYLEAPLAYDAIWAVAIGKRRVLTKFMVYAKFVCFFSALNYTMQKLAERGETIENYNYGNAEIGALIKEQFGDVKFDGVSVSGNIFDKSIN